MAYKSNPNREVTLEELESVYLTYVGNQLEYLLGSIQEHQPRALAAVQAMIDTRAKIEGLRKKSLAGKLTLGEALQHFRSDKESKKPRRRKLLTRYQRVMKNL